MKKKIIVLAIILICVVMGIVIYINNFNYKFEIVLKSDADIVKVGDVVTLIIDTKDEVVGANFEIDYFSDYFELIDSDTENLYVSEKDEKIACIYFDIKQEGIREFKIRFKAIAESNEKADFSIKNVKFRQKGQEESYIDSQINGIHKKISIQVNK